MIKGLLSLVIFVAIWFMWAMIGTTPCARIERGASPIRAVFESVHWALSPWASMENKLMLISWSIKSDQFTRALFSHQFYGKTLTDVCPQMYKQAVTEPSVGTIIPAGPASAPESPPTSKQ